MARQSREAPDNLFGISDPAQLERIAGSLATQRLGELELGPPLTEFTRESLLRTHHYLMLTPTASSRPHQAKALGTPAFLLVMELSP